VIDLAGQNEADDRDECLAPSVSPPPPPLLHVWSARAFDNQRVMKPLKHLATGRSDIFVRHRNANVNLSVNIDTRLSLRPSFSGRQ